MNYINAITREVSASEFIPAEKENMTRNLAGGVAFKADNFTALNRWLFSGSFDNLFYENSNSQTDNNLSLLTECILENPSKVHDLILNASKKGTMKSQHTCILALVHLSMGDNLAKEDFKNSFNSIIRTGSHLYEFLTYVKVTRGMGSVIKRSVTNWINSKTNKDLEYQFLKYQQREGFSNRDVLRLIKPSPRDESQDSLFSWVVGKEKPIHPDLQRISVYEKMKKGVSNEEVVKYINDLGLTQEMIPSNIERTPDVWNALFQKMPVMASVRNLPTLTRLNLLTGNNLKVLEERLSREALSKSMIHPIELANALKYYSSGGTIGKTKAPEYSPVSFVMDLLDDAVTNSFDFLQPTGLNFFHALDISGSMLVVDESRLALSPLEIETIMALSTIKSEKNYFIGGFSKEFSPLSFFSRKSSLRDLMKNMNGLPFGGTNAGSAYKYAIDNKIFTDTFVFWTDSENWGGTQPSQLLSTYRKEINPEAKVIYITLAPYSDRVTLSDPKDKKSFDIAGFSSDTPKIISMLASGQI